MLGCLNQIKTGLGRRGQARQTNKLSQVKSNRVEARLDVWFGDEYDGCGAAWLMSDTPVWLEHYSTWLLSPNNHTAGFHRDTKRQHALYAQRQEMHTHTHTHNMHAHMSTKQECEAASQFMGEM